MPAKLHCPRCLKDRKPMKTEPGRCGICGTTLTVPTAAPRPTAEVEADIFTSATPAPFVAGSATSEAAAASLTENALTTQRRRIMAYVIEHGSATDDELEDKLDLLGSAVRPRRGRLVIERWLEDSGTKRPTRRGREAVVWQLGEKGRAWVEKRAAKDLAA